MIDNQNRVIDIHKRHIVKQMGKILERFCMDESLNDITFRVDMLDLQKKLDRILKEYHEKNK